jgi:hypothetical protein
VHVRISVGGWRLLQLVPSGINKGLVSIPAWVVVNHQDLPPAWQRMLCTLAWHGSMSADATAAMASNNRAGSLA